MYHLLRHRLGERRRNNEAEEQRLDGRNSIQDHLLEIGGQPAVLSCSGNVTAPLATLQHRRPASRNVLQSGVGLLLVILTVTCVGTSFDLSYCNILLPSICNNYNNHTIQQSTTYQKNTHQEEEEDVPPLSPSQSETTWSPSPQPFSGSTLSKLSDGMDVMENVCVFPAKRFIDIHSYTVDGKSLYSDVREFFDTKHNRSSLMYASSTIGNPLDQWTTDVTTGQWIQEETLLALAIYNPGHCLQDEIFPIALDRYVRKNASLNPAKESTNRPFYKRLLYLPIGKPAQVIEEPKERDWCLSILNHSGLVDANQAYSSTSKKYPICFRRLLLPRLGVFRFPFDYSDRETMDVYRNHPTQSQFVLRDVDRPPFTDSYPVEAFEELRRESLKGLALPYHPWDAKEMYKQENEDNDKTSRDLRVLMYDRRGLGFRSWVNSLEVRHQLEAQYHVSVTHVNSSDWETMKLPEQATLINTYPRLLMPHGGHEGNLIFCRPKASVIEIECLEDPVASLLDETDQLQLGDGDATLKHTDAKVPRSKLAYYGPPNFYTTYTRRIGIEHFVIGEVDGCHHSGTAKHFSPELTINVSRIVNFVANRWSLVPRTT